MSEVVNASIDIGKAARRFRVNEKTIRRWVKSGRLQVASGGGQGRALRFDVSAIACLHRQLDTERDTSPGQDRLARTLAAFASEHWRTARADRQQAEHLPRGEKNALYRDSAADKFTARFIRLGEYWRLRRDAARVAGKDPVRAARLGSQADATMDACLPPAADVPANVNEAARRICAKLSPGETDFFCAYLYARRNVRPSAFDTPGTARDAWESVNTWANARSREAMSHADGQPINYTVLFRDYLLALKRADFGSVFQFLWGVPAAKDAERESGALQVKGILNDGLREKDTVREYARAICKTLRTERRRWQRIGESHGPTARELAALYGCNHVRAWRMMGRLSRKGALGMALALLPREKKRRTGLPAVDAAPAPSVWDMMISTM